MPLSHFLVYRLTFRRDDFDLTYFGATGVYLGQTDRAALEQRRRFHREEPVCWLKGFDEQSLRMHVVKTNIRRRADALAAEAQATALECKSRGTQVVRGGPWCLRGLSAADRREIAMVSECQSMAGVQDLGRRLRGGSLAAHLAGDRYDRTSPSSASPGRALLPILVSSMKRASGRSCRSGPSGRSGKSGVSGHSYRKTKAFVCGSPQYLKNKWGRDPAAARCRQQRSYRERRHPGGARARAPHQH
jgi:hypothetical protein